MPDYRLYLLDDEGRIRGRLDLQCEHDAEAIQAASEQSNGAPSELWQGSRVVKRFPTAG